MSNRRSELVAMPTKAVPLTHPGYQPAHAHDRPGTPVSENLYRAIARHVVRTQLPDLRSARYLFVQGRFGEGKSETIRITCSRLGMPLVMVAASELAGETEGAATEALDHLEQVGRAIRERDGCVPVFVIEDFDNSIVARRASTEYSCNSQLVETKMQFIADTAGFSTLRGEPMPIILTGNDFSTGIRGALLRPGRAEFFTFAPTADEKASIVAAMFPGADDKSIKALLKAHPNEPVAFFHDVKNGLLNSELDDLIAAHGVDLDRIRSALAQRSEKTVEMARVRAAAAKLAAAKPGSFLNWRS